MLKCVKVLANAGTDVYVKCKHAHFYMICIQKYESLKIYKGKTTDAS